MPEAGSDREELFDPPPKFALKAHEFQVLAVKAYTSYCNGSFLPCLNMYQNLRSKESMPKGNGRPTQENYDLAKAAIQFERQFAANHHSGSKSNRPIIHLSGTLPLIISCPHAVNHPREGRLKLADTFTGPLAMQLAAFTKAHALIYARTSNEDPNYDADGPYKRELAALIRNTHSRFVLDIHGMGRSRPVQIAIGTAQGRTLGDKAQIREAVVQAFRLAGFSEMFIDVPNQYDASRAGTVTSYVWNSLGVPAMQVEIHKEFRDPQDAPEQYENVLFALRNCVLAVEHLI